MNPSDPAAASQGWPILQRLKQVLAEEWNPDARWATAVVPVAAKPLSDHLCVMVVDDDALNLLVASEMLGFWGITPLLAQDGAEAVALASELRVDLVLMDLQMPRLDGAGATRAIRRLERDAGRVPVPIVAYTATATTDDQLRAWGMEGRLDKPCDVLALRDCVLRWCLPQGGQLAAERQSVSRAHWARLAAGPTAAR